MQTTNGSRSIAMFKLLLIAALPAHVWTYKVLMIPWIGKSHVFSMGAIAEGLVNRGHEVTFFVGENFPLNVPELRNRTEFSVVTFKDTTDGVNVDYHAIEESSSRSAVENGGDIMATVAATSKLSLEWCQQLTADDDILDRLEQENFDVAVLDLLFFTKCMCLVPHRLRIPWIAHSVAVDGLPVRVPWLPSFVPNIMLPFSEQMTFSERLTNTAYLLLSSFVFGLEFAELPREVQDKFRRFGAFTSLDELVSKSVLLFMTVDNVLDYPRPMMPNMVSVAGLTVKRSTGRLPPDIRGFIDGAERGVILVTFGTVTSSIPTHMVEKFASAFRRLGGYRVIWRLKNEDGVELPENVMIGQWLPQNDILAHPSVKLFITHCGNNGQYEAVYHAVPMIGFPLFGDQMFNAKRLDYRGFGLSMNLFQFTADELFDNVQKILGDSSYKERISKASEIFRSRAQSPVERATFWIEHVCRFGGDHLRSAGNDLPLYSYLMLDVVAFFLIILHILVYLLYKLLKYTVNKCREHKNSNALSKKNI